MSPWQYLTSPGAAKRVSGIRAAAVLLRSLTHSRDDRQRRNGQRPAGSANLAHDSEQCGLEDCDRGSKSRCQRQCRHPPTGERSKWCGCRSPTTWPNLRRQVRRAALPQKQTSIQPASAGLAVAGTRCDPAASSPSMTDAPTAESGGTDSALSTNWWCQSWVDSTPMRVLVSSRPTAKPARWRYTKPPTAGGEKTPTRRSASGVSWSPIQDGDVARKSD